MTATAPAAPVYVDQNWHEGDASPTYMPGERQYRATDDPRLLAIIERSSSDTAPDGDGYAPAYRADYRGGWSLDRAGSGFDDEEAAEAVARAWDSWGAYSETAGRFLRIFHGVTVHELSGPSQGDLLVILDTPAHRELTGGSGTSDEYTKGDRDAWRAYLDGDVWAIGYAVNPLRTTHDEPVDLDDWTVEIESYGYYGEDSAREAALGLDGGPTAVELDALTASAHHTAATVSLSVTLDDSDRDQDPERPWTASCDGYDGALGATRGDALRVLATLLDADDAALTSAAHPVIGK